MKMLSRQSLPTLNLSIFNLSLSFSFEYFFTALLSVLHFAKDKTKELFFNKSSPPLNQPLSHCDFTGLMLMENEIWSTDFA